MRCKRRAAAELPGVVAECAAGGPLHIGLEYMQARQTLKHNLSLFEIGTPLILINHQPVHSSAIIRGDSQNSLLHQVCDAYQGDKPAGCLEASTVETAEWSML